MGIRFQCPNGHKMNVKAFLAGRRGLCPICGAKFDIPFQSEPEALAGNSAEQTGAAQADGGTVDESTDTIVLDLPYLAAAPTAPAQSWASPIEPAGAEHQAAVGSTGTSPDDPKPSADSARHGQNRPAAPTTKWYLRLGTGEQFGPVRDELMRQWFDEGSIRANTPIWRDGWSDWQAASSVFRAAVDLVPTPPEIVPKPMSSGDLSEALSAAHSPDIADVAKRRPWTQKQWTTLISLTLLGLIVILGTIMLVMLLGQIQSSEPQTLSPSGTTTRFEGLSEGPTMLAQSESPISPARPKSR